MAITKSGTRVTLRYETGDPFGNTNDPFNYQRVVDFLDPVNVYQDGDTIIFKDISIYIEGSETAFVDSGKNVTYSGATDDYYLEWTFSEVAKHELTGCYLSTSIDARHFKDNTKHTYNRCIFKSFRILTCNGYFTLSSIYSVTYVYLHEDNHFINSIAVNCNRIYCRGATNLDNFQIINAGLALYLTTSNLPDELEVQRVSIIDSRDDFRFILDNGNPIFRLTDSTVDITDRYTVVRDGNATMTTILQKTLNTNIQNSEGGTLKIYDNQENEIYSEVLTSDAMTEQKIEYDRLYLENTDGVLTAEERTIKEPFTLKVTKTGYQDLVIPGIYATELQDDGSRVGTLSPKTVSGKMERIEVQGENLTHNIIEDTIQHNITEDVLEHNIID